MMSTPSIDGLSIFMKLTSSLIEAYFIRHRNRLHRASKPIAFLRGIQLPSELYILQALVVDIVMGAHHMVIVHR